MADRVRIDQMATAIMEGLQDYANLASDDLKKAVKKAGATVKKEIQTNAPKNTGTYASSWTVKNVSETSNSIDVVVHSKNRYQLAHLLEFGHAKRGGGRVPGKSHIAAAEEAGIKQLEQDIERSLTHG